MADNAKIFNFPVREPEIERRRERDWLGSERETRIYRSSSLLSRALWSF